MDSYQRGKSQNIILITLPFVFLRKVIQEQHLYKTNIITSKSHNMQTYKIHKLSLSCYEIKDMC